MVGIGEEERETICPQFNRSIMTDFQGAKITRVIENYTVYNPNFYSDVIRYLRLTQSKDDVSKQIETISERYGLTSEEKESGELTMKEKLTVFIDRVEFIQHLRLVSDFVVQSRFRILGQEVNGLHWDIHALNVYLALTCIDIFYRKAITHKTHFENILLNTSNEIKDRLTKNVAVESATGVTSDLKEIAEYLYSIRNYYTHSGKRFHVIPTGELIQFQSFPVGSQKHKEMKIVRLGEGFNLTDCILEIVIYEVKRLFEWI